MKKHLLKSLLALALVLITGNAWAETATYTMQSYTSKVITSDNNATWSVSNGCAGSELPYTLNSKRGAGFQSGNTVTSSFSVINASKITVVASSNGSSTTTLTVKVGNTQFGEKISLSKANHQTLEFTAPSNTTASGNIEFTITRSDKTLWIGQVIVETANTSTKILESIAVSGAPTKTTYEAGEEFDPAGLVVTGTYDDESNETITSGITWNVTPSGALTAGTTSVSVTATVSGITSAEYQVNNLVVNEFVQTYANTYTSDASLSSLITGSKVKWEGCKEADGYDALKIGKASTAEISVPAGTKTVHLHMVAWNGESADVTVKLGSTTLSSIQPTADAGVSGTSTTYTIAEEPKTTNSYYFAIDTNNDTEMTLSLTTGSNKRAILFGVNIEKNTAPFITSTTQTVEFEQKSVTNAQDSKNFSVTAGNLSEKISVSMKDGSADIFEVTPSSLSITDGVCNGDVTVSYETDEAGEYTGTILISSGDTKLEIPVSVTIISHDPELQSITISGTAETTEYLAGESFSFEGLTAMGHYDIGEDKNITDQVEWTASVDPLTKETSSVNVTATVGNINSDPFGVDVTVIPVYSNLAVLIEDGTPTTDGKKVCVTFTNEVITKLYISGSYTNGIFLQVGSREIEIYCKNVPSGWKIGGKVSGTIIATWKLYNDTWELCPQNWSGLEYKAPGYMVASELILDEFSSFSGSGYQSPSNYSISGVYGFAVTDGMLSSNVLQLKASTGKLVSPVIETECGFDIEVTYTSTSNMTLKIGDNTVTNASLLKMSTTETSASFTLSVGSKYATVSSIKITPKVLPVVLTGAPSKSGYYYATFIGEKNMAVDENTIITTCYVENGVAILLPLDGNVIPANSPVLVYSDNETITLIPTNEEAKAEDVGYIEDADCNMLFGYTTDTHVDAVANTSYYALNVVDGNAGFFVPRTTDDPDNPSAANGFTAKAGKAYLKVVGAAPTIGFRFGDATQIENVSTVEAGKYYDLMGREVLNPAGGIYILNGKKVLVK